MEKARNQESMRKIMSKRVMRRKEYVDEGKVDHSPSTKDPLAVGY